jgi:hypothetical protein
MTVMHSEEGGVTVGFLKDFFFRLHLLHDVKHDFKLCICKNVAHCKAFRTEQGPTDIPKTWKFKRQVI